MTDVSVCEDCRATTSGRCWRHSSMSINAAPLVPIYYCPDPEHPHGDNCCARALTPPAPADLPSVERELEQILTIQPRALAYIRSKGFIIDKAGPLPDDASDLDRWKVLAFSLYTDLAEATVKADRALARLRGEQG